MVQEPDSRRPEEARGQRLVRPGEVAPEHVEVHENQGCRDGEQRQGQHQAVGNLLLVQVHEVCHNQAGTAIGGVAGGDGCCHHTQYGQDGTDATHPRRTNHIHEQGGVAGGVAVVRQQLHQVPIGFGRAIGMIRTGTEGTGELDGSGCPDQSHDTLGDHCAVEDATAATLVLQAARHKGRLRAVETADGAAGDGDAEEGEDGQALGMMARERRVSQFRQQTVLREETEAHAQSHNQQRGTEERIEATDERVDGQ